MNIIEIAEKSVKEFYQRKLNGELNRDSKLETEQTAQQIMNDALCCSCSTVAKETNLPVYVLIINVLKITETKQGEKKIIKAYKKGDLTQLVRETAQLMLK